MKRWTAWMLVVLCLCGTGFAETDLSGMTSAGGNVAACRTVNVTAPFSGTLLPFDWQAGDRVAADDLLFEMNAVTVYAGEAGRVTAVFAREGDDAAAVLARYGALVSIEGENPQRITATAAGARDEWKTVRVGQPVYFRSDRAGREKGSGRVIAVGESGYAVEVLTGNFIQGETLNLYAEESLTNRVGTGMVSRRPPVSAVGAGRVRRVFVHEGDEVARNRPLLELVSADADPDAVDGRVRPSAFGCGDGVITLIAVQPGQQVWKGQLLAQIACTDRLEIVAMVDEMDLPRIAVGTVCPVVLDMEPDLRYNATVTEIGGLGVTVQNAAYYRVRLSLEENGLPLGASCSVYLPEGAEENEHRLETAVHGDASRILYAAGDPPLRSR